MSEHVDTQDCDQRRGPWRFAMPPMLTPMKRGRIDRTVQRTRLFHGLAEVRKTWHAGLRAMLAEAADVSL